MKQDDRQLCGRVALEENSDDIPLVVQEYIAAGIGEERPGSPKTFCRFSSRRSLGCGIGILLGPWSTKVSSRFSSSKFDCLGLGAEEFTFDVLQKPCLEATLFMF